MPRRGSVPPQARLTRNAPGFVRRQLAVAGTALHLGEIGAACAALRVLQARDFVDPDQAAELLIKLRRHRDGPEARSRAVETLLRLGRASIAEQDGAARADDSDKESGAL